MKYPSEELFTQTVQHILDMGNYASHLNEIFHEMKNDFIYGPAFMDCQLTDYVYEIFDEWFDDKTGTVEWWIENIECGHILTYWVEDEEFTIPTIHDLYVYMCGINQE